MNRLRTFFHISDAALAAQVMRNLADYRQEVLGSYEPETKERLFALIARIEAGSELARTDALERFVNDQTLDELIGSIERDINADRPAAALDRVEDRGLLDLFQGHAGERRRGARRGFTARELVVPPHGDPFLRERAGR